MKLENEFTVPASIDQAWAVLLDVPRVAPCLPGATVEDGRRRGGRVQGPDEDQDRPDHRQLQGHGQDPGGRRGRPPRRDARAGQGRARPGHRGGDDHLHDGGGRRRHEDHRRHRHARHRPGRPVRPRRDAGRLGQADDPLRRLPGRADAGQPGRRDDDRGAGARGGRGHEAATSRRADVDPRRSTKVEDTGVPGASSGVSSAEAEPKIPSASSGTRRPPPRGPRTTCSTSARRAATRCSSAPLPLDRRRRRAADPDPLDPPVKSPCRHARCISDTFWVLVLGVVALFAFFAALGAFEVGEAVWLTVARRGPRRALARPRDVGLPAQRRTRSRPPSEPANGAASEPGPRAAGHPRRDGGRGRPARARGAGRAGARRASRPRPSTWRARAPPVARVQRRPRRPASRSASTSPRTRAGRSPTCTAAAGCWATSSPSTPSAARWPTSPARAWSASTTGSRPSTRSRPALDDALDATRARRGRRRRRRQRGRQPRRGRRAPAARSSCRLQLLIYPVTDAGINTPSYARVRRALRPHRGLDAALLAPLPRRRRRPAARRLAAARAT